LALLEKEGIDAICLTHEDSKYGTVETFADATACSNLFRRHVDKIDGVLVSSPNFGDERGVANAIRMSGLKVPVLVQAYPDNLKQFAIGQRRDAFCGRFSVCSNLTQYNIPFTLTSKHTMTPSSPGFIQDLPKFAGTCRVVRGLKNSRFGAISVRPSSFNSVRYSEKLLEHAGISIDVIGLTDIIGRAEKLSDADSQVQAKLQAVLNYTRVGQALESSLLKMAKFGVVMDNWMTENALVYSLAVLERDGGIFWYCPLHHHEHDEQRPITKRMRSRCSGSYRNVRITARFGNSQRPLSTGTTTTKMTMTSSLFCVS
jgi:L-fucose isomerase-like protein